MDRHPFYVSALTLRRVEATPREHEWSVPCLAIRVPDDPDLHASLASMKRMKRKQCRSDPNFGEAAGISGADLNRSHLLSREIFTSSIWQTSSSARRGSSSARLGKILTRLMR